MRIAFIIVVCLFATSSQEKNGFVTPIHRIQFELCLARGYSESGNEEKGNAKESFPFQSNDSNCAKPLESIIRLV